MKANLPVRWRDEDPGTVDHAFLDDQIAGCVSTWLSSEGRLDAERLSVLRAGLRDIDRVLPLLTDDQEIVYADRLRQFARLVCEVVAVGRGQCIRRDQWRRIPSVERSSADLDVQRWVLQPLADAGLNRDTMEVLLFRLGFEAIVSRDRKLDVGLQRVAGEQSAAVKAALAETIDRMLIVG